MVGQHGNHGIALILGVHESQTDFINLHLHMDLNQGVIMATGPAHLLVHRHDRLVPFTFEHRLQFVHQINCFHPLGFTLFVISFLTF